jgi:MFS family permease
MASAPAEILPAMTAEQQPAATLWRWVHVGIAALAMVLTFPGRTHGLGLFTEPLLNSLDYVRNGFESIERARESYGFMNLWATLLGAAFCLPCGWLLDRFGTRAVFLFVTSALGATVIAMSMWTIGSWVVPISFNLPEFLGGSFALTFVVDLFVFLLLTRGLGQSALSVVSLGLIGRSAGRKSGLAMGVYAFGTTAGFLLAFSILGEVLKERPTEWRDPWLGLGLTVLVLGFLSAGFIRNRILETGREIDPISHSQEQSFTVRQALASPAFWTFTIGISFYGLIVAGTSLFNQSILKERGFDTRVFVNVAQIGIPIGLAANLLVGWLATRWSLAKLMALATALFAAAMFVFPYVQTENQVYGYALTLAAAGGGMTVCFFMVYRRAFGPARLGTIQGVAQMLTVLFSAVGPMIFASTNVRMGSYSPIFPTAGGIALVLAVLTWIVGLPTRRYLPVELNSETRQS